MQDRELSYGTLIGILAMAVIGAILVKQPWLMLAAPVIAALIIWAGRPRVLLLFLCFSISWSMEWQITPTLGTDFPDEPLMWLLSVVVCFVAMQEPSALKTLLSHPVMIWIGLLWCWSWVSAVATQGGWLSWKYVAAKLWYILSFVWGTVLIIGHRMVLTTLWKLMVVPMIILACITMVRHAATGFSFSEVSLVSSPYFRNHVNYGALLVCTLPIAWFLYRDTGNRWWMTGLVVLLAALYFSYSRGAWLALPVGLAAVWLLKKRVLIPVMIVTLVAFIMAGTWLMRDNRYLSYRPDYASTIYHEDLKEHMIATYTMKDLSTAERFYRWIAAWRMAEERPLFGVGPNHFYPAYRSYTVGAYRTYVSENPERSTVHNYFLLLLSEQGVPALVLFVVLIFSLFITAQRIFNQAREEGSRLLVQVVVCMLAMILVLISLSDLIEADKIGSLFYLCAGLLISLSSGANIKGIAKPISEQVE